MEPIVGMFPCILNRCAAKARVRQRTLVVSVFSLHLSAAAQPFTWTPSARTNRALSTPTRSRHSKPVEARQHLHSDGMNAQAGKRRIMLGINTNAAWIIAQNEHAGQSADP